MNPNHYVLEQLARQKEAEIQQLAKHAWLRSEARRLSIGQRAGPVLMLAALLSFGLMWLLA